MEQRDLFAGPSAIDQRTYFALYPAPALSRHIFESARTLAQRNAVRHTILADRLHVSLNNVQRGGPKALARVEEALAAGAAVKLPAFTIDFDRLETWDRGHASMRQRPTVLRCSEQSAQVTALYHAIRREMQRLGLRVGPPDFNPHITLWYSHVRIAPRVLQRPLRMPVERFCLVQTTAGTRAVDVLASWALDA